MSVYDNYEMTIGIECHVQLATKTKLFSAADNDSRFAEPNSNVSPIDYGLPGMLPVLNHHAVELAVKAGKALGSTINLVSSFDRKHYFYPDLPKGYQTTQMYHPIIGPGVVEAPLDDGSVVAVRIHHAHMEEDAGKLTHHGDYSLVDLNRAGTPLIEIVSEPDIHSAAQARAYAVELYRRMTYAGVTHGDLYHGNMRFDVNISVAPKGAQELGKRTEIKNLNSFRGWNDDTQTTTSQRSKEDAQDYRYMPDPDIPPIVLTDDDVARIQADMPELPAYYRTKWAGLGLDRSVVNALLDTQAYAQAVAGVQDRAGDTAATRVAHWFASATAGDSQHSTVPGVDDLATLANMAAKSEISSTSAKELFHELLAGAHDPRALAEQKNLLQVSDESAVAAVVDDVLADPASASSIADIVAGKEKAIGYLVGQVMKRSQGKANPAMAQKIIRQKIL